jgi:CubicO group peptidase (beta-lactamase class C family)
MCPDNINEAMDYAFQDGNFTGAVIVIRNGYIVAERYADDRMATDLVTSWSVAKSFTSALIGKALDEGLISSLDQQVSEFIPAWKNTDKEVITLRQLMTVKTALELLDGGDFYGEEDQLQVSIDRNLIGQPGEQLYTYSNSDVMLAGEVVR